MAGNSLPDCWVKTVGTEMERADMDGSQAWKDSIWVTNPGRGFGEARDNPSLFSCDQGRCRLREAAVGSEGKHSEG